MTEDSESEKVRAGLAVQVRAFTIGLVLFLGVGWYIRHRTLDGPVPPTTTHLSNLAVVMLAAALVGRTLLRRKLSPQKHGRQRFEIFGAAVIQFAGLLGGLAYLRDGTDIAFGVGVLAAVLLLALQLPTRSRWERWAVPDRPGADVDRR